MFGASCLAFGVWYRKWLLLNLWNGFDFYNFYSDRINRIIRIFLPAARDLLAEGHFILLILLILSNQLF